MYIAIEGINGSGKSSQAKMLVESLQNCFQQSVHLYVEPDKEMLNKIFHENNRYLATAMYLQRLRDKEKNLYLLKKGDIIVSDRSFVSTFAYQGLHDWDFVCNLHETMKQYIIIPDVVFVMRIDTTLAMQRVEKRDSVKFTQEAAKEIDMINKIYDSGQACVGLKSYTIDAHQSEGSMNREMMYCLSKYIWESIQN